MRDFMVRVHFSFLDPSQNSTLENKFQTILDKGSMNRFC